MNKIFKIILITLCIFISGCTSKKEENLIKEKEIYQKYIKSMKKINKSSKEEYPFDIEVKYDKITKNEVRYQVIIDNPKEKLTNISALAMHNKQTDDIFPSTGIFDKKQKLIPGKKPSGIILVGYIPYTKSVKKLKCEMKILIRFSASEKTSTVYYVTKKA